MINPYFIISALLFWIISSVGSFTWGYHVADNSAQVKALKIQISERDAKIEFLDKIDKVNTKALRGYSERLEQNEKALSEAETRIKAYTDELANKPPPDQCLFNQRDIDQLFGK